MTIDPAAFNHIDPVDVVLPPDNPWLRQWIAEDPEFLEAMAELLPPGPVALGASKYSLLDRCWMEPESPLRGRALAQSVDARGILRVKPDQQPQSWHIGPPHWYGPVTFGIDRGGQLVHHDGKHRATLAYLLGRDLPVRIVARHPSWEVIRNAAIDPVMYDAYPHPDLLGLETVRKRSAVRFGRAIDWLQRRGATRVIDYGSHCGHFAVLASRAGLEVHPVESRELWRQLAAWWSTVEELTAPPVPAAADRIDAATCFSSIQHIGTTHERLAEFLDTLRESPLVVLEVPNRDERIWPFEDAAEMVAVAFAGWSAETLYVDRAHLGRRTVGYSRPS